jgi:hypothetical protein
MATKDEIKAAILGAAGNPSSGTIYDFAEAMATAVSELDKKSAGKPANEIRIVETKETR